MAGTDASRAGRMTRMWSSPSQTAANCTFRNCGPHWPTVRSLNCATDTVMSPSLPCMRCDTRLFSSTSTFVVRPFFLPVSSHAQATYDLAHTVSSSHTPLSSSDLASDALCIASPNRPWRIATPIVQWRKYIRRRSAQTLVHATTRPTATASSPRQFSHRPPLSGCRYS